MPNIKKNTKIKITKKVSKDRKGLGSDQMIEKRRLYEESMALKAIEEFDKDKKAGKLFYSNNADDLFKTNLH